MQGLSRQRSEENRVLCGSCPDEQCQAKLFFPAYDKSVECTGCGKRHEQTSLQNIAEVTNPSVALHNILKNILLGNVKPKKGTDDVKVLGLSNYVCKSISPILTHYGMDKRTGKAILLRELSQQDIFNCGKILGDRAFLIEEENLEVIGYGRDRSGSVRYLADILKEIKLYNDNEERLVPIHADGDGHCLVHAVSRALVGRELFWHALRLNLSDHFQKDLSRYKEHFREFIDIDEWDSIIRECDPDFIPSDGEPLGLRNIHVFGLANVLHRPVILLDSCLGMQSSGDYSGVFLPALVEPEACRSRDGTLNKPLCIAWSSSGRNHYIPLVGIKGRKLPNLPRSMIQRAWGVPSDLIDKYIEFDHSGLCRIGGDKCLSDKYIRQLVSAMDEVFIQKNGVPPQLVADVHQFLYKSSGIVGVKLEEVIETTKIAVEEHVLYRCLTCEALIRYQLPSEWFRRGGSLYNLAVKTHKTLLTDKKYVFPYQGVTCLYNKDKDILVPDKESSRLKTCSFCQGETVRLVKPDGSVQYYNGDRTLARSTSNRCACGFKHYWDGKEYDNIPEIFPVTLQWNGKVVEEKVSWFQYETDPSLNSNVFQVAQRLVQQHFPGEFGSERLVQQVVDTILRNTASRDTSQTEEAMASQDVDMADDPLWSSDTPSKIILTGYKHQTLHKEELTKSQTEKNIRKQVESQASKNQHRRTKEVAILTAKSSPKKSKSDFIAKKIENTSPSHVPMETTPSTKTRQKKVRLATSDGRQVMLTLDKDLTFNDLQQMIHSAVDVPPKRQKIRVGFPPKELKPPPESESDRLINLQHGDKIALEVLPDPLSNVAKSKSLSSVSASPAATVPRMSWSHFDEDTHPASADSLLQSLKDAQDANDTLDASIASLAIMATIAGKDLWTQVQSMPHLFSVGGLFYKQVERDLGLVDGKHCQLPSIPGKVFRYNAKEGRLELCMEPYGHFPIEPGVDRKVAELKEQEEKIRFGSSGALKHETRKQTAFSGEGHSLQKMNIERMPSNIVNMTTHHHHGNHNNTVRTMQTMCDPNKHEAAIPEDMVTETSVKGDKSAEEGRKYQRLGPGYSVLDADVTGNTSQSAQFFKEITDSMEKSMQEIDQEMERLDEEEKRQFSSATENVIGEMQPDVIHPFVHIGSTAVVDLSTEDQLSPDSTRPLETDRNQAEVQLSDSLNDQNIGDEKINTESDLKNPGDECVDICASGVSETCSTQIYSTVEAPCPVSMPEVDKRESPESFEVVYERVSDSTNMNEDNMTKDNRAGGDISMVKNEEKKNCISKITENAKESCMPKSDGNA
ncbi:deubiquitinating protein VCPIP1-like [Ylistrum balloti]|uniref:deubiquitinating protein VCPIP1-like n=1 Tax=Ylistrum balloti TaxID=509963 RepID=UPI002905975C|nr:deubiquitinating protein VCPIP1-like [Ylistrum balloti]